MRPHAEDSTGTIDVLADGPDDRRSHNADREFVDASPRRIASLWARRPVPLASLSFSVLSLLDSHPSSVTIIHSKERRPALLINFSLTSELFVAFLRLMSRRFWARAR